MNDQLASAQFDERVLAEKIEDGFLVPDEEFEQFIVVNVASGDEQELGRAVAKLGSDFKVRVFGDQGRLSLFARAGRNGSGVRFFWAKSSV